MVYDSRHNHLENTLQKMNTAYIALEEGEQAKNSSILISVVSQIITEMKKNKLFKSLYRNEYSGGSYFCGLKVGKPDEYDIDLLLKLPVLCNAKVINSDVDGFVHIQMRNMSDFNKQLSLAAEYPRFAALLLDDEYNLSRDNLLDWMESVINKALNQFKNGESMALFSTPYSGNYYVNVRKQGPAFTFQLYTRLDRSSFVMSVDLVPCFVFTDNNWPTAPYRANPIKRKNEFFVVPKLIPTCMHYSNDKSIYWRLSFQEQENEIIKGSYNLKPALRLLKRIRDAWDHKAVSSYYIKTIFLWAVEHDDINWDKSLSYVFMTMLKRYQQYIESGSIPYYWNTNLNLLYGVHRSNLNNTSDKLKKMINDIEKFSESPQLIEKVFRGPMMIQPESTSNQHHAEVTADKDNARSYCLIS